MPESPSPTIRTSGTDLANTSLLHRRTKPVFRRGRTPRNIPFRKVQGTTIVPTDSTVTVTCRRLNSGLYGRHRSDLATQQVLDGPEIPFVRSQEERVQTALRKEVPLGKLVLRVNDDVKEAPGLLNKRHPGVQVGFCGETLGISCGLCKPQYVRASRRIAR